MNLTIITDTREQNPLSFSLPVEGAALKTGDYSIKGLERFIAIERKSPDDLVACLKSGNRERFEKELSRGRGLDYFALVIESDMARLANGDYRSEMTPKSVLQFFFCPGRKHAARVIESLLSKYVCELEKRLKAVAS